MSGERSLSTPSASLVHPVSGGQFESGAVSVERETIYWTTDYTNLSNGKRKREK